MTKLMYIAALGAFAGLAGCMSDTAQPGYQVRHIAAEPMFPEIPGDTSTAPAIRILGPRNIDQANRAMAEICGFDPAAAAHYGDHGDRVMQDPETSEWIYWLDCR